MPGGDDPEHVALVNEVAQHLTDDLLRLGRVGKIQVEVVDDDDEDAARGVSARPAGRKDQAVTRRHRRTEHVVLAPAVDHRQRDDLLLHAVLVHLELARF